MRKSVVVLLVLATVLVSAFSPDARGRQNPSQQKSEMIRSIQSLPGAPTKLVNPDGSPITIQGAFAREISKATFKQLTGAAAGHSSMSTYPDVEILNTSGKTITSFMLVVKSRVESADSGHGILTKELSIEPGGSYKFTSDRWPQAEKAVVQKNDKFVPALKQPGLDSPKSWLPGSPSDLAVTVGMVIFQDGTQWRVPDNFEW